MKKIVLLFGIVALTLGMSSCNSKSDPTGWTYGSLEMGSGFRSVIFAADGTKLEAESGYTAIPEPAGSLNRQLCFAFYSIDEGNNNGVGPGKTLPIRLQQFMQYPTRTISSYTETENRGDAICDLYGSSDNSALGIITNFLFFSPIAHYYTITDNIPDWSFSVEVEPEIEEGEKYGIINLWLNFSITNTQGATEKKGVAGFSDYYHAIDLDYLSGNVTGFKKTDENGEDTTYILQLNYKAHPLKNNVYDESTVEDKSVSIEWTPNKDPYNKL